MVVSSSSLPSPSKNPRVRRPSPTPDSGNKRAGGTNLPKTKNYIPRSGPSPAPAPGDIITELKMQVFTWCMWIKSVAVQWAKLTILLWRWPKARAPPPRPAVFLQVWFISSKYETCSGFLLCSLNSLDISTLTLCKVTASAFVELYRPLYYSNQVWWGGAPLEAPVFHQERFCQRGNSLHRWKKNTKCWRSHFVVLCTRGADGSVKKTMNRRKKKLICCYLFLWHLFQQQLPSIQSDLVLRPDSRFQRNFHSNAKHSKNRKSAFVYSIYSLNCSCAQITENIQGRRKQWDCSWSVGWRCHR